MFFCEYCEIFKSACFEEHMQTAASKFSVTIHLQISQNYVLIKIKQMLGHGSRHELSLLYLEKL